MSSDRRGRMHLIEKLQGEMVKREANERAISAEVQRFLSAIRLHYKIHPTVMFKRVGLATAAWRCKVLQTALIEQISCNNDQQSG